MKKRISLLLILSLLLTLQWVATPTSAQSPEFEFKENKTGITITKYNGTAEKVAIPKTINNKPVTVIGSRAFMDSDITSVTIPNTVEAIEEKAFSNSDLKSVTIPSSVKSIGSGAFCDSNLERVTIKEGIKIIGDRAFCDNDIKKITIPNSVTNIGEWAFSDNEITEVTIPSNVKTIGSGAFAENKLKKVTIKKGVTTIKKGAFSYNKLTSVTIPKSVKTIEKEAFAYNKLKTVKFKGEFSKKLKSNMFNPQGSDKLTFTWYKDKSYKKAWNYQVKSPMTVYAKWQIPSLASKNVTVSNKIGNDKITLKGLKKGFTYTIYKDAKLKKKLKSFTAKSTTKTFTIKQVGAKGGALYVVVSKKGYSKSKATKVTFKAQPTPALAAKNVKVTNNKGKSDTIKFTGLKKGTTYTIYKDAKKKSKITSFKATSTTKTITVNQLGKSAGKIYITAKAPGYTVSALTTVSYAKEKETSNSSVSEIEQEVVRLVNIERSKKGLPALKIDSELAKVARLKSQDMYDKGYFDHTSPTYGSPFDMMEKFGIEFMAAGENIAWGYTTAKNVVNGWMNSPGHRANILSEYYTHIGVGYVASGHYWTQMFIGK